MLLAACGDRVRQAKIASDLRAQLVATLQFLESHRTIPGLQHGHVSIELDSGGGDFAVQIYDLKLGDAALGFQSFNRMSFVVAGDDKGFIVRDFEFSPKAISDAPDSAPGMLIAALQAWAPTIRISE
jgi:hypothetical protein